ncbi:MAG: TPM domain-containing protein [Clostridia bacterium]|nr:TPM domain-containing protein [Clostridia bacterium]
MKRLIAILLTALLLLAVTPAALAAGTPVIEDRAGLFTAQEEELLREGMQLLCEYGTPMLWTTRSAGDDLRDKAGDYYEAKLGRESGVLLVIDMRLRELAVYADGEAKKAITSSDARIITDNIYRYASRGDYYGCACEAFSEMRAKLEGRRIAEPLRIVTGILLSLSLALLLVYTVTSLRHRSPVRIRKGRVMPVIPLGSRPKRASKALAVALVARQVVSRRVIARVVTGSGSGGTGGSSGGFRSGGGGGFHSSGGGGHSGSFGSHKF